MNESDFLRSVTRLLPDEVYYEKNHNPYHGGTPDLYIEGPAGVAWIEGKHFLTWPRTLDLTHSALTRLQQDWLDRAHYHGINCAVLVGCQQHGLLLQGRTAWTTPITREDFLAQRQTRAELADQITRMVTHVETRPCAAHRAGDSSHSQPGEAQTT